jgi:multiple sugar transport system ATP-binding protein
MMAQVVLEKVSKVFSGSGSAGVRAVDGVDLTVADRELVVLVGPSGCGKSTTLRMIAGLEAVSGGVIRIGLRVVNEVPPKDRDIAMVFQNYALYPHLSVYKNLAFGLKLRRMPRAEIERRVMEAAKILDLEHFLDRKPQQLSGGQRQRVAVGRAIVREPAAFLFDEPLSNLDAKLRVTTRAQLKRLHQRLKTTMIYVTHDQEEAMTLGDRIVVMKDGRIQQADTPLATYNRPVNRFVAGFIGMPPMNFFDGVIKHVDGQLVFEEGQSVGSRQLAGGESCQWLVASCQKEFTDNWQLTTGNSLTLPGTGFRIPVADDLREVMADWVGQHVVLGIRPEHMHLRPIPAEGNVCPADVAELSLRLQVIEPLGHDMDLYMATSLHDPVVGRVEAQAGLVVGSQICLRVDLRRIHFFEPGDTGMNLSLVNESAHAFA